jgi:hypothetical protein
MQIVAVFTQSKMIWEAFSVRFRVSSSALMTIDGLPPLKLHFAIVEVRF